MLVVAYKLLWSWVFGILCILACCVFCHWSTDLPLPMLQRCALKLTMGWFGLVAVASLVWSTSEPVKLVGIIVLIIIPAGCAVISLANVVKYHFPLVRSLG